MIHYPRLHPCSLLPQIIVSIPDCFSRESDAKTASDTATETPKTLSHVISEVEMVVQALKFCHFHSDTRPLPPSLELVS